MAKQLKKIAGIGFLRGKNLPTQGYKSMEGFAIMLGMFITLLYT